MQPLDPIRLATLALLASLAPALDGPAHPETPEPEPGTARALARSMVRYSLEDGRAYERLGELCRVAPHRLAGSEGAARAVEWAREEMLAEGLENVRLEPCTVPHWERGEVEELLLLGEEPEPLRILALGGSVATAADGIEAEVIEVRDFDELAARAEEARGRIVFFNRPMDPGEQDTFRAYSRAVNQRSRGAIEAAKVGGLAAIVRSMTTRLDDSPHTGAMRYDDDVERVPSVAVSTLGAERLAQALREGGSARVRLRLDCRWLPDAESHNVVGEWVGSELPEEVVVVGGHLDAWDVGEGAHDDGAGCSQAIEVVRTLRRLDLRPRRTIRVVLFMNEENGTRGARAYYEAHREDMEKHVFALESDRGGFVPRGFTTDANPAALEVLRELASVLDEVHASRVDPGYGGVDISPMRADGVITAGFLPDRQRYFDVHHSERDTFDRVHERELELGAAAMALLCYRVADLAEPLPRNTPPSTER